jgi:transcriptional regulator with XRE-family HTH domain
MTTGELIRNRRLEYGYSQRQFATLVRKSNGLPVSPQTINDYEHNRRPLNEFAIQIAKLLDIPLEQLVEGTQ